MSRLIQPSKLEAVHEDELGVGEAAAVGGRRGVDVGVAVGPDERRDLDAVAADVFREVGEDREGRDHLELRPAPMPRAPRAARTIASKQMLEHCDCRTWSRAPLRIRQASRCLPGQRKPRAGRPPCRRPSRRDRPAGGQDDRRAGRPARHGRTGAGPQSAEAMPMTGATTIMAVMSAVQKRAAAAGSIIRPTARSVPSAWKPPTRLRTTRPRKTRWVGAAGAADRAQEGRVDAFEDQRPEEQRPGSTSVTVAIAARR